MLFVRLVINVSILVMSITCTWLLSLINAPRTKGPQVVYVLVLILPIIFACLTTDVHRKNFQLEIAEERFELRKHGMPLQSLGCRMTLLYFDFESRVFCSRCIQTGRL